VTTATVDDKKRVRVPGLKPGQVVSIESSPDGTIKLVPIAPVEPRRIVAKLVKRGKALIFEAEGRPIDPSGIADAINEERESLS
jgi:hypothetical protein